jgi:hypothetical protein
MGFESCVTVPSILAAKLIENYGAEDLHAVPAYLLHGWTTGKVKL